MFDAPVHYDSTLAIKSTLQDLADVLVHIKYYVLQRPGRCTELAAHECIQPVLIHLKTHLVETVENTPRHSFCKMNTEYLRLTFVRRSAERKCAWAGLAAARQR